eukprot:1137397-Pelagomonas_calceolata.AAC.5
MAPPIGTCNLVLTTVLGEANTQDENMEPTSAAGPVRGSHTYVRSLEHACKWRTCGPAEQACA